MMQVRLKSCWDLAAEVLVFSVAAGVFAGCGTSERIGESAAPRREGRSTAKPPVEDTSNSPSQPKVSTGRKEINGIPYDVFFDDPLSIGSDTQKVVPAAPPNAPTQELRPSQPPPVATQGTDWKQVIPKEVLETEVKRIRNRLTQYLQSVGNYNQNIFQIPPDVATLAVLASIAGSHPEGVSWKANARFVRDLAAKMVENEVVQGRKSFEAVERPFLNIVDILGGSPPSDMSGSEENVPFSDVADFGALMKRLDRFEKWAKSNVGARDSFKEHGEAARHEAYVVAAISKVIITEGYGFADDDDFKAHALPMLEAALRMAAAVEADDFEAFDEGRNTVSQKCTQCHGDYRE